MSIALAGGAEAPLAPPGSEVSPPVPAWMISTGRRSTKKHLSNSVGSSGWPSSRSVCTGEAARFALQPFSHRRETSRTLQKYKAGNDDGNMISEPSSPQSSTRSRSPSPDDILERAAADVKEYERENLNTFEASIKAKHNLIAQEKDGNVRSRHAVSTHTRC